MLRLLRLIALLLPLREYQVQLSNAHRSVPFEPHPRNKDDYLNWRYLKEIPLIQAWAQAMGHRD